MRIAMLADRLILGGLETHIVTYVNELLRRGHRLLLYTAFIEPGLLAQIKGGDALTYQEWSDDATGDIARFSPEVIHSHPFTAIIKGSAAAEELQKPFVVTMHEFYDFGLDKSALGYKISAKAHTVIAIDRAICAFLRERVPEPEKLTVIHNGIDTAKFSPRPMDPAARVSYGLDPQRFTLAAISRFDNGKERPVFQLLRTAASLADILGGMNLIIVGGGSWYSKILEEAQALAESRSNLSIYVAGYQTDVRDYIAAADLVLACDRAAMEALACQRPVLAANAHGYAGTIDARNHLKILSERRGYRPLDDGEFISLVAGLARDREKRSSLAGAGREIILRHFDMAKTTTELEDVYRRAACASS